MYTDIPRPKMTHHPYLEITLSARPLGLESERDTTCQYLLVRRRRNRGKAGRGEGDASADEVPAVGDGRGAGRVGVDEAGQREAPTTSAGIETDGEASVKNPAEEGADGRKKTKAAPGGDAKKRKAASVASQEDRAGKRKKGAKSRSGG